MKEMLLSLFILAAVQVMPALGQSEMPDSSSGYRLESQSTYMIIAPKRIYPNQVIQVHVSIFKLYYSHINVRASIRAQGEELTYFMDTFYEPSTRLLQMQLPDYATEGNYTLRIEGTLNGGVSGNIFENETDIFFNRKQISMFITTNKYIYRQGQEVKFRIIPIKPNMMPMHGSMDVYAMDANGITVRRWLAMQTNAGILDMSMQLSDQPTYGKWKILAEAFGLRYEKEFLVEEFYQPRFYVNVSMPMYIMEDSFGLAGVLTANHTSGRPVRGDGNITLEIRDPLLKQDPDRTAPWPNITKIITFFEGKTSFLFTMREMRDLLGTKPINKELYVHAHIHDWYLMLNNTGFAICVVHSRQVQVKLLGDKSRTFKPGFPVSVYYAIVHSDGTPLYGNRRQVTVQRTERSLNGYTRAFEEKLVVRDDGIVQYSFIPNEDAKFIRTRAYYDMEGVSQVVECFMYRMYTHYGGYLAISTSTEQPIVNEYMVYTVRTNTYVEQLYYLIVASGNIVVSNRLDMRSRQKTFSVALSRDMVPSARIVCWHIENGEVVADGLNFFVNGTRQNPVEVKVNMGKDFSRDTVEITGITDPGAYIAFSGIDYDVYTYGGKIFIDENDVIEELETYDSHANQSFEHTFYLGEEVYRKTYFPAPTYGVDANTTFDFAGLLVFTDANLTRIPHDCNETRGYLPCHDGMCYLIEQRCDNVMQCEDAADEMGCPTEESNLYTPPINRFRHLPRHYMEEGNWLWKSHFVKPDGRIDLRAEVPKEPMAWVVGAVAVSRETGLGVSVRPARYQTTRFFYIQTEAPEEVVRGEQIGIRIALFNYWNVDLECLVTLHDSDQYRFILVEDFGIVSSYKPRTTRGNIQTMVFVQASRMMTIYMPVLPIVYDELNITISATSFMGNDQVTKTVRVVWDGVTNYYNTPYLVDLINHGSMIIPDFEVQVPERFVDPGRREHLFVPGSGYSVVSIVGDVVGPGFFAPYLDAENMMRKPYGCGEQNLFNFAANLYYLKFLKVTNQLQNTVLKDALNFMNLALQRQLSYYNKTTGAFSMFRDYRKPTPSTWLTSHVLSTISDADEADWEAMFYVPSELKNKIAIWLCQKQNKTTGAFFDEAPLYNHKMKSNMSIVEGAEVSSNVSLTAQVLVALSKARGISGSARTMVDNAKVAATRYVEQFVPGLTDPFQTALVTYALTLANSNRRNDAFYKLQNMRISGEFTYWALKEIPPNPSRIVNTVPFNQARNIYPYEAYAVEATGYALMVYLRNNRLRDAQPIMKWLQTMRNSIGGFGSTRDSVVALEALTEYGKRDTNRDLYNMRISLEATSTPFWRKTIDLNKENWAQAQLVSVPKVWGEVKAVAQGTGMALMQMHTQVNVEYPNQQAPKANGSFYNIEIDRLYFSGKNFSIMEMTACARWLRPELSERTGMTVMEITIPTGYVTMNDDLRYYVQSGIVPTLNRAEYYDRKVVFYLDYVEANKKTCVAFRADRWYPIANATIQHEMKVYDYYEPGLFNRTLYTTFNLFNLHICQVCGSFQCPYCPFYNTATNLHVSLATSMVAAILVLVTTTWLHRGCR